VNHNTRWHHSTGMPPSPVWNDIFRRCNTASSQVWDGWKMAPRKWFVWHTHISPFPSQISTRGVRDVGVGGVSLLFPCTSRISLFRIVGFLSGVPLLFFSYSDEVGTVCQSLTPRRTPTVRESVRLSCPHLVFGECNTSPAGDSGNGHGGDLTAQ